MNEKEKAMDYGEALERAKKVMVDGTYDNEKEELWDVIFI